MRNLPKLIVIINDRVDLWRVEFRHGCQKNVKDFVQDTTKFTTPNAINPGAKRRQKKGGGEEKMNEERNESELRERRQ